MCRIVALIIAQLVAKAIYLFPKAIYLFPMVAALWLIWMLAALIRQARRTERPLCSRTLSEIKYALEAWSSATEKPRHRKESLLFGGLSIEASGRSVALFSEVALGVSLEFSSEGLDDRLRYLHGIIVEVTDRSTQPTEQRLGTVSTPDEAVEVVERFLRHQCPLEELPSQVFSIECYLDEQDRRHNAHGPAERRCDGTRVYAWHGGMCQPD